MNTLNYLQKIKNTGVIGIISSVFLGIPLISSPTSAQTIVAPSVQDYTMRNLGMIF